MMGVITVIPEDVLWLYQQIFGCEDKNLLIVFVESWLPDKAELLAEQCDNIIQTIPTGDQTILGFVLAQRASGFDWFFKQYFQSAQALKPYIAEFEQYCAAVSSGLQTPV